MELRRMWSGLLAVLAVLVLGVTLAACGSDDDDSSSSSGNNSADTSSDSGSDLLPPMPENTDGADVDGAREAISAALEPLEFTDAPPPVDASQVAGSIWTVTCGGGNLYCKTVADAVESAAEVAGMTGETFVADDPAQNSVGIQTAVSRDAAAIVLVAVDPASVAKPLEAARKAGVKVISIANTNADEPPVEGTDANVTVDFTREGALNAQYAIAALGADAETYCGIVPAFRVTELVCEGFKEELANLCPDCAYSEGNFNLAALEQEVPAGIQSEINKNPDLNFIMCSFDNLCQFVVPGVKSAGAADRVMAGSQTGQIEPNLGWVRDGDVQMVDVGIPNTWNGWAAVDQAIRLIAGEEPAPNGGSLPVKLFTHESLAAQPDLDLTTGEGTANEEAAYGTDGGALYQDVYKELWGVN